jgi:GntR family transcriptional regulator/MocR family aminotransferase
MRSAENLTVAITLDRTGARPMHEQLADQLVDAVHRGALARGSRVPSTRALAAQLRVSRSVALAAYDILLGRGYIEGRPGSGSYVAAHRVSDRGRRSGSHAETAARIDMTAGQLSSEQFPLASWRAAWRQASFHVPPVTDLPPLGLAELRAAIADHLRRAKGLVSRNHEVVITTGVAHGLQIVLEATEAWTVATEDPSLPALRQALRADVIPLPVDGDGARLDAVTPSCRVAVVTPDAHAPLGHVMSASRRRQLAAWARDHDGWIVEVTADQPAAGHLPRLTDLAGERTFVVGSFCGVFTPTLRLGYVLLPRHLLVQNGQHGWLPVEQPSYVTQLAVTRLLAEDRAVRRVRQLGRLHQRKATLVDAALEPLAPNVSVTGRHHAGTVVLRLPDRLDAELVSGELRRRGVLVSTLGSFHLPGGKPANGLVLGYGHLSETVLRQAFDVLVDVLTNPVEPRSGSD